MIDGRIEILGKRQVMLPCNVVEELQKAGSKKLYTDVKKAVVKAFEDYAKRIGSSEEGILKNVSDIFETFGLGKMEIVQLEAKKKQAVIQIKNGAIPDCKEFRLTAAVISGTFSFLFNKDVDAEQGKGSGRAGYTEYLIK